MVLLPSDRTLCVNERWNPLMSAAMPTTTHTPMTMPASASSERRRLANSADSAMPRVYQMRSKVFTSLPAKRLDRIEAGGPERREAAEEDAHRGRHREPEQHAERAHRGGQHVRGADRQ